MSEKIKKLGFELVGESQCEVTYKKEYDAFVHIVAIEVENDINIFSYENKKIYAFKDGKPLWSSNGEFVDWDYAKLAEVE